MVNLEKIDTMIIQLANAVEQLQEISNVERTHYLGDQLLIGGSKYYLQTAIETCINIGNHIIASEKFRSPKDYRDVFSVLNENELLPDDFTITLRQMAGMRNRLVHLYWEVDDEVIYDILSTNLDDFDTFTHHILTYVKSLSSNQNY